MTCDGKTITIDTDNEGLRDTRDPLHVAWLDIWRNCTLESVDNLMCQMDKSDDTEAATISAVVELAKREVAHEDGTYTEEEILYGTSHSRTRGSIVGTQRLSDGHT